MKNQKFFFSVVAVLFVLGVLVLFFFGFNSRVFAQAGTVRLVEDEQQVAGVNRGVACDSLVHQVTAKEVINQVSSGAVNDMGAIVLEAPVLEVVAVPSLINHQVYEPALNVVDLVAIDVLVVASVDVQGNVSLVGSLVKEVANADYVLRNGTLV